MTHGESCGSESARALLRDRVMPALERQAALYDQLAAFGPRQDALISQGEGDQLLRLMGERQAVVDELVELIIEAPDREALINRTRALDRVLLHGHYVVPNWHLSMDRIAYWSFLERPSVTPKNGVDVNNWWYGN